MPDELKEVILDKINTEYVIWLGDDSRHNDPEEISQWFLDRIWTLIDELKK